MIYRKRNESDLQISVANWFRMQYPRALWTICPAGIKLPVWIGAKFKAMGYRQGSHDIIILEPRGGYHGMTIELKMPGGKATPEQVDFQREASERGYYSVTCPKFKVEQECFESSGWISVTSYQILES